MQKMALATVAMKGIFHICSSIDILSMHTKFKPPMTILRKSVWVTLVGPTRQKNLKCSSLFMFISHGDYVYQKSRFYDHFEIFRI